MTDAQRKAAKLEVTIEDTSMRGALVKQNFTDVEWIETLEFVFDCKIGEPNNLGPFESDGTPVIKNVQLDQQTLKTCKK